MTKLIIQWDRERWIIRIVRLTGYRWAKNRCVKTVDRLHELQSSRY